MIVVLPVCHKDVEIAKKNLEWIRKLDGQNAYHCVVSHDKSFDAQEVLALAEAAFDSVYEFVYETWRGKQEWPTPANWAWQETARMIAERYKEPWLWWEPDAVPIKKGWLDTIREAHERGGRAFTGHVVPGMGHMNGVGVYPPVVAHWSRKAFLVEDLAFDVALQNDVQRSLNPVNELIGNFKNTTDWTPSFRTKKDYDKWIGRHMVLWHKCKDGSLVDFLRGKRPSRASASSRSRKRTTTKRSGSSSGSQSSEDAPTKTSSSSANTESPKKSASPS